jgi:hypothetical protein
MLADLLLCRSTGRLILFVFEFVCFLFVVVVVVVECGV